MARCGAVMVVVVVVTIGWWTGGGRLLPVARAGETDPKQDLCVGNLSSPIYANGFLCKTEVNNSDFVSRLLRNAGDFFRTGAAAQTLNALTFPALNTQGIAMNRVDFLARGLVPPHHHPRATELIVVTKGVLHAYFVTTATPPNPAVPILEGIQPELRLFHNVLYPGDATLFPRALPHFVWNPSKNETAQYIAAYNSQNQGFVPLVEALFATHPPVPDIILTIAFNISKREVRYIRDAIGVSK